MNIDSHIRKILGEIPAADREALHQKRIFFGHQSVGSNILSGVQALSQQRLVALEVVEGRAAAVLESHLGLAHAKIGENRDPGSKIRDFATLMRTGFGARADVAFFKFCYVDFESDAHVRAVFDEYRSTMATLEAEFPGTTFVHVTSPLTVVQSGPKAMLKSILGRKPAGVEANMARFRFNEMLKQEYEGKAPVFDLAAVESTYPDGSHAVFEQGGRSYPKLVDAYSSDGGHLNADGARWVAAHLVRLLATLPKT
ncbi:MAG: hypothetical protein JW940_18900 [Polyangiaceae bacterium]|nr:hypothetical protein [Polyangiaceae bacterium]